MQVTAAVAAPYLRRSAGTRLPALVGSAFRLGPWGITSFSVPLNTSDPGYIPISLQLRDATGAPSYGAPAIVAHETAAVVRPMTARPLSSVRHLHLGPD
eukprot:gene12204-biopygen4777